MEIVPVRLCSQLVSIATATGRHQPSVVRWVA
jgi:hypothetical protein